MILISTLSYFCLTPLLFLAAIPNATEPSGEILPPLPPLSKSFSSPSYVVIILKDRATDLQHAFELLKKEKSSGKVYFQLNDGTSISNIIDLTLLPNSSLFLFRYNTNNQGIKLQVVKIEDIVGISYY